MTAEVGLLMAQRPTLNPAFQSIFLLIAIDLLAGYWLGIHREQAVEFFLSQVPLIGAAGVLWSFFPKDAKENFGAWLEWALGGRLVRFVLGLGLVALVGTTFFRVSASVTLAGDAAAWLYFSRDLDGDLPAAGILDSTRLNRLTSPVSLSRWRGPGGLVVWAYTPTMISKSALTMRFWRPASAVYPEDFDSLAAVTALPGAWLFNRLPADTARVVVCGSDAPRDTVATFTVSTLGSFVVSFLNPGPAGRDTFRWREVLAGTPDSMQEKIVGQWSNNSWVTARRPIRRGDRLTWTITIGNEAPRTLQRSLDHAISQVYLAK